MNEKYSDGTDVTRNHDRVCPPIEQLAADIIRKDNES